MLYFTADEHYGHYNIIKYCKRPFKDVEEMNGVMITLHNELVCKGDTVIHIGDFTLESKNYAQNIIRQLTGNHVFLKGSHDYWLPKKYMTIWHHREKLSCLDEKKQVIVACHYAMRVWPQSHYGSWQVYGHSHGSLPPQGKQCDVGVDNWEFYPVSLVRLEEYMRKRPDNFNMVKKE